jgi:hypothetical protein
MVRIRRPGIGRGRVTAEVEEQHVAGLAGSPADLLQDPCGVGGVLEHGDTIAGPAAQVLAENGSEVPQAL